MRFLLNIIIVNVIYSIVIIVILSLMPDKVTQKLNDFFLKYPKIKLSHNEIIIHPNEKINYIYFLKEGNIKQYTPTLKGEDIILHIFSPGAYFPVILLLSNEPNKYYFQSMNESVVNKVPSKDVLQLLKSDIDICFNLTKKLSTGLSKMLLKAESTFYQDSYYRVISIMLYLVKKFGKQNNDKLSQIDLPLTHYDIASWTGIQRETASRQLEKLTKKKIIFTENHIFSVDLEKLITEEKEYKYFLARK